MPGRVQIIPTGLLGLFQIKNDGNMPSEVAQFYQPTLEMLPWLTGLAQQVVVDSRTLSAAGAFGFTTLPMQVPQGKCWLVKAFDVQNVATLATESVRFRALVLDKIAGTVIRSGRLATTSLTDAAGIGIAHSVMDQPFIMLPGEIFGVGIEKIVTAATIQLTATAKVYEFPT